MNLVQVWEKILIYGECKEFFHSYFYDDVDSNGRRRPKNRREKEPRNRAIKNVEYKKKLYNRLELFFYRKTHNKLVKKKSFLLCDMTWRIITIWRLISSHELSITGRLAVPYATSDFSSYLVLMKSNQLNSSERLTPIASSLAVYEEDNSIM